MLEDPVGWWFWSPNCNLGKKKNRSRGHHENKRNQQKLYSTIMDSIAVNHPDPICKNSIPDKFLLAPLAMSTNSWAFLLSPIPTSSWALVLAPMNLSQITTLWTVFFTVFKVFHYVSLDFVYRTTKSFFI
ncbi:unnamed protein product [Vicia faba]|uniref:Uncharacterized protein n=1 Tax=Vicia faba TaxID=3906 RepID=A0AAV1A550_VICFA|nr:unnamed protein product [Vicia faba]